MIHQYKNNGYNIVLDVNSGSVHVVDDIVYDIIALYENSSVDEIADKLKDKYKEEDIREACQEIEELKEEGIDISVVDMYTIKPLDTEMIETVAKECGCILTLEEHSLYGGLGGAVAEVVAQTEMVPLDICGIPDEDVPNGSDQEVFKYYKMDAQGIKDRVKALISKKGK